MFDASVEDELLSGSPDYVLDCIDNIDTKVLALHLSLNRDLRHEPSFLVCSEDFSKYFCRVISVSIRYLWYKQSNVISDSDK